MDDYRKSVVHLLLQGGCDRLEMNWCSVQIGFIYTSVQSFCKCLWSWDGLNLICDELEKNEERRFGWMFSGVLWTDPNPRLGHPPYTAHNKPNKCFLISWFTCRFSYCTLVCLWRISSHLIADYRRLPFIASDSKSGPWLEDFSIVLFVPLPG